jgi:glucan phosphoethanolaminetransferase (alkaline phosphatase superfamily)
MHSTHPSRPVISPAITALLFSTLLIVWESSLFGIDYLAFFERTTTQGYQQWLASMSIPLVLLILASLAFGFVYVWAALRSGPRVRAAALLLFALAVLYEYGYQGTLQRFSTPEDAIMVLLYQDPTLYQDAILTFFNPWALIPIAAFGALLLVEPRQKLPPSTLPLVICTAALIFGLSFRVWFLVQSAFPTLALSAFLRTATYAPLKIATSYHGEREAIPTLATRQPPNNVVLIVDESIRGDHLSVNGYGRPTTPYLEELARQGVLYNWGEAAAAATCSLASNNLLLTGFSNLPDPNEQIRRWPTLFQYAQALGYRTYYLDASATIFWNGTRSDLSHIDSWENAEQFLAGPPHDADHLLAARLHAILAASSGNFIWVNKRGVHFDYNNTFPADQAIWTPVMNTHSHDPAQRTQLVNSYDNGVRYNLEGFFRTLVADGSILERTTVVYTSDHGQTLAENGEHWPHCNESRNEALVPLLLLGAPGLAVDTAYAAGHGNIFATLLDLMGVPEAERRHAYGLSLLSAQRADSRPRSYYVGALDGTGGGGYRPFDGAGADRPPAP